MTLDEIQSIVNKDGTTVLGLIANLQNATDLRNITLAEYRKAEIALDAAKLSYLEADEAFCKARGELVLTITGENPSFLSFPTFP